jgi:hypothetical protein
MGQCDNMVYTETVASTVHEWELVKHIELSYADGYYGGDQHGFSFGNLDPNVDEYKIRYDIAIPGGNENLLHTLYINFNNDWVGGNYVSTLHEHGWNGSANVHNQWTDRGDGSLLLAQAKVLHTSYRYRGWVKWYPQQFNNQDTQIIDHTQRMTVKGECEHNYSLNEFFNTTTSGLYNTWMSSPSTYLFTGGSATCYGTAELYKHVRDWR